MSEDPPNIELRSLFEAARSAHPELLLLEDRFLFYLRQRLPPPPRTKDQIAALPLGDLYLACGCLSGDPIALRIFASLCEPIVAEVLRRLDSPSLTAEEVQQEVLVRLLMPAPDQAPKLAQYTGKGSLPSWVRMVATREALMLLRKTRQRRQAGLHESLAATTEDLEVAYLRRRYGVLFQESLAWALEQLEPRQRNLLRQQTIHGWNIDEIAALYRVNRATAARWLMRTRQELFDVMRSRLSQALHLAPPEFESLLRFLRSQLDISLIQFLPAAPEDEGQNELRKRR